MAKKNRTHAKTKKHTAKPTSARVNAVATGGSKTVPRSSTVEAKPTRIEISQQAIAEAAYYLWLQRGGDEISNWLEAERQLRQTAGSR